MERVEKQLEKQQKEVSSLEEQISLDQQKEADAKQRLLQLGKIEKDDEAAIKQLRVEISRLQSQRKRN